MRTCDQCGAQQFSGMFCATCRQPLPLVVNEQHPLASVVPHH